MLYKSLKQKNNGKALHSLTVTPEWQPRHIRLIA